MSTNTFHWPDGKRCAVSLTYDDGLPVHYGRVGPLLESEGLRGTFYVPGLSDVQHHPECWRTLAAAGHELGNHSLFHPCRREPVEGYAWLAPHYDLCDYTPKRWREELNLANLILHLIDGRTERSYGNNCCHTTIGRGDDEIPMDDILRERFVAARGPCISQISTPQNGTNLMQVGHFDGDAHTFGAIREDVERARDIGGWIVYMIHGVGEGTHSLYIDDAEHEKLIRWLGANRDTIWTAPFLDVARYVNQFQKQ